MNCPKCKGTANKSKFASLTGYDSYRCSRCNYLFEANFLYHVAHPEVKCLVVGKVDSSNYVDVLFEKEVTFRWVEDRVSKEWTCNNSLLCKTQEEARKKHIPK